MPPYVLVALSASQILLTRPGRLVKAGARRGASSNAHSSPVMSARLKSSQSGRASNKFPLSRMIASVCSYRSDKPCAPHALAGRLARRLRLRVLSCRTLSAGKMDRSEWTGRSRRAARPQFAEQLRSHRLHARAESGGGRRASRPERPWLSDPQRGRRRAPYPNTVQRLAVALGLDDAASAGPARCSAAAGWRSPASPGDKHDAGELLRTGPAAARGDQH